MKAYAAKEVYMGYYWLVLVIDPYKIDFAVYSWEADNQIGMPIPDCVKTAMRETGERGKSTQIHHPRGISVLKDDDDQMYFYNLDNLFEWHIKKGIRLLHTREGKPITQTEDLKRLWTDNTLVEIKSILEDPKSQWPYPKWHFDRLKAYLSDEHRNNLSKLEEAEKAQKTSLLVRITPTSPARVVGLLASIVTLIMFVYWLLGKL